MGIDVDLSTNIRADPEVIWSLLEDPASWKTWWRGCIAAQALDDRSLREGSQLEVVLQPKLQKFTFRPVVDLMTENRTLSLTHRSPMVQTTTAWYLAEKPDRTQVSVQSVFNGVLPFFMSILQQRSSVQLALKGSLQGLRRVAERKVFD
ncbi:MAG: SRPBCC family protein [Acidobacteriota bacterium]